MSFLTSLWAKILNKLGVLGAALTIVASQLRFAIKQGDAALVQFRLQQIRELGMALIQFADKGDEVIADGVITPIEGGSLGLELEQVVMEAADIIKRKPEPDAPGAPPVDIR